ncbi:cellobiose dehydrogenase-like protein [Massarina eburnea CBS 473.64]|uniref:Cellobiose dehydrogenase-like protein n=1 Tax=Massarina eburnea CBS 473.64 TaxID=1395130 RepID=A0A6A6S386_9PLEO|nr:cellobiose dehydrogenase-like protein [Massarina eburnea CBS 473.64]
MKFCTSAAVALAFAGSALGEVKSKRYCDAATSICYAGLTTGNTLIGIALPDVKVAPFDTILQITSPTSNGWVGFSWGGTMPYVPLTVGWQVKAANTTIYSSRMAFGLSLPQPYDAAEYTYLKGTGFNSSHWILNVRCRGCSQWQDTEGKTVGLDPQLAATTFAHALSLRAPSQPASNKSTFNVHTSFSRWDVDLSQGKNADFDKLVAANIIVDQPPPVSSTPISSPTPTSSPSTSIPPSGTPAPIQTGIPASCAGVTNFHSPVLTSNGWKAVKVAGNLIQPRGLVLDSSGNLLVVQNGLGVTAHTIDSNGCFNSTKTIITQRNLNHGIFLSQDGKTLYASSATQVHVWDYDAATQTAGKTSRIVINGMDNKGHVTRTITIPPKHPNLLIVSHGSNDNFDYEAGNIKAGRSCVKAFDLTKTPTGGYNYASEGYQLGYGLRNGVGLAFDADGMLWEVENASDEIRRIVGGTVSDIHFDNPADELNYIGDPSIENTKWYGYPTCYTVWKPELITDHAFAIGDQFVLTPNETFADATCNTQSVPSKLAFQAHSAPLDAVFNKNFTSLLVTFHGSWNRANSTGYKVVEVPFTKATEGYRPRSAIAQSNTTGYSDVLWNPDVEHCSTTQCFRPVSIAKDRFERMYITSDSGAEGEILILGRA